MKKVAILIVFIVIRNTLIYCQKIEQSQVNLSASLGFIKYITNDQLINYYNYSRIAFMPAKLVGSYHKDKNFFFISLCYNQAKLFPNNENETYYEYNYLKQWNIESGLEYYRRILLINKYIRVHIGTANNTYVVIQKEYFKNMLYDYAQGFRQSYDLSILNLSSNLLIDCNLNKSYIRIRTGYTLLNVAARPDDNYVKQIGLNDRIHWKTYSLNNYKGFQLSLLYQHQILKNIGVTAEFALVYHSYLSPVEYRYLAKSIFVGVSKTL